MLLQQLIRDTNLSYDQNYCPFSDQINVVCNLQLLSVVNKLRYVHHSQATSTSYTFTVADYRSSTPSYTELTSDLDSSVKCTLSYWLATLQHIPCIHSTFWGKLSNEIYGERQNIGNYQRTPFLKVTILTIKPITFILQI